MKKNTLILILAVAVLAGAMLVWLMLQQTPETPAAAPTPVTFETPTPPPVAAFTPRQPVPPVRRAKATPAPAPDETPLAAWEQQIDTALRSHATEAETAYLLLNMIPSMPEEGQVEAAQHAMNLLPDEDFPKARPLYQNPRLPEAVLEIFLNDLLNRDDNVKLPALLEIARIHGHPLSEEAIETLEIYTGDNFGTDWGRWQKEINDYLADEEDDS